MACEIELPNHSPLIIAALYRPPYNDIEYRENLCDSLNRIITKYKNPTVWLAGDLNLPNIDWSNNTVNGNHYPPSLCNVFLDFMAYHGLVQMNLLPTRYNNILDVFFTNQPLTSISVETAPGISDHEAVIVRSAISVKTLPVIKRKVYIWHKADFSVIDNLIANFTATFLNHPIDTPVQQLWDSYKALCADCLKLVPTKILSSINSNQPWATPLIRRLSRRKQRLYSCAKLSALPEDWIQYRTAKKLMQQECRLAHTKYLSDILNSTSSRGHKNLWSYVKSKRRDQVSIPPLEVYGVIVSDAQEMAELVTVDSLNIRHIKKNRLAEFRQRIRD